MAHNPPDTSGPLDGIELAVEQGKLWGQVEGLFLNDQTVADVVWTDLGMFAVVAGMRVDAPGRCDGPICITNSLEDGQTKLSVRMNITGVPTFISMVGQSEGDISRVTGITGCTATEKADFCRYVSAILGFAKFTHNASELAMLELRGQYSEQGKTELDPNKIYKQYSALLSLQAFCRYLRSEKKF